MRLIDADALLKELNDLFEWCRDSRSAGLEQSMCMIHEQPTITQWIPVSERLPDGKDDSYLVTRTDGKFTWVEEGDFVIDVFIFIGDEYRFNLKRKIENIAWMPLPEPYHEYVKRPTQTRYGFSICPTCGETLDDECKHCPKCGQRLGE